MKYPVKINLEPLTSKAFAPYGYVIDAGEREPMDINEGTTKRFDNLCTADVNDLGGEAIVSIFRANPRAQPIVLKMMERHPLGSQAFMPLGQQQWIAVVSPAVKPSADTLKAFLVRGDQGLQYHKNVWHHPLLVINSQDFLVVDRKGKGKNLEEVWFDGGRFGEIDISV